MQKLLNWLHFNDKGFTLVELMVVVVIIGILVAIAIPVYNSLTIRAEQATLEANLRIIDSAIASYYAFSKKDLKQDYQVTLLSLPAAAGSSLKVTPTALVIPEPEGPRVLSAVEDLVKTGYLAAVPLGPENVSYGITGEAPNQRAAATGVIGKEKFSDATLNELPWRQSKPSDVKPEPEVGKDDKEDKKEDKKEIPIKPIEPIKPMPLPAPDPGSSRPIPMPVLPEAQPFI